MASIEIIVRGSLAESVTSLIASRFTAITVERSRAADSTRIEAEMDQAAERALLALLWDTGHDVMSMRSNSEDREKR